MLSPAPHPRDVRQGEIALVTEWGWYWVYEEPIVAHRLGRVTKKVIIKRKINQYRIFFYISQQTSCGRLNILEEMGQIKSSTTCIW